MKTPEEVAAELRAPMQRLLDAYTRGINRRAPMVKVRTEDIQHLFAVVGLGTTVAKAKAQFDELPWWKRALNLLRAPMRERPEEGL